MERTVSRSQLDGDSKPKSKLSLDTWAVLVALTAAVLIRLGLIHVRW
jgi:hypothetical protein